MNIHTQPPENPRVALGGNNPPLADLKVMEFEALLNEREGFMLRIDEIEATSQRSGVCADKDTAGRYADFVKMCTAHIKVITDEREIVNRPLLDAQRALKARADALTERITTASSRVRAHLDAYLAAERQREEDERRRQAEEERQRQIAAEAERRRLQAIEDARVEAERQRLQAEEDARAAAEKREAAPVEVAKVEVAPVPVFTPSAPTQRPIARGDYGAAASTAEVWTGEVANIRQLPDSILKHPDVVEAANKVIRARVRGGERQIKGARIWSEIKSRVR